MELRQYKYIALRALYYPDILEESKKKKGVTSLKDNYIFKQPYDIYPCGI